MSPYRFSLSAIFKSIVLTAHCFSVVEELKICSDDCYDSLRPIACSISYKFFLSRCSKLVISSFACFSATSSFSIVTSLNYYSASITSMLRASLVVVRFVNRPSRNRRKRLILSIHWKAPDMELQTGAGMFFQASTWTDLQMCSRDSCIYLGPITWLPIAFVNDLATLDGDSARYVVSSCEDI